MKVAVPEGTDAMETTATAQVTSDGLEALPPRLKEAVRPYASRLDVDTIARAYRFAERAHEGQRRASGEEYIVHCVEVAKILADLHLDTASIAAGLIHDVVEDTTTTLEDVRAEFGDEIAQIVDGVTKIGKVQFRSTTEQQVENYRKLLLSMAQEARGPAAQHADAGPAAAGQATSHRAGDDGDLRPAGAPAGDGADQVGAGGSGVQAPGAGGVPRAGDEGRGAAGGAGAADRGVAEA